LAKEEPAEVEDYTLVKHSSASHENVAVAKRSKAGSKWDGAKEHAFQNPFAVFTEGIEDADENAYANCNGLPNQARAKDRHCEPTGQHSV
jgi:hypothetical protein